MCELVRFFGVYLEVGLGFVVVCSVMREGPFSEFPIISNSLWLEMFAVQRLALVQPFLGDVSGFIPVGPSELSWACAYVSSSPKSRACRKSG